MACYVQCSLKLAEFCEEVGTLVHHIVQPIFIHNPKSLSHELIHFNAKSLQLSVPLDSPFLCS